MGAVGDLIASVRLYLIWLRIICTCSKIKQRHEVYRLANNCTTPHRTTFTDSHVYFTPQQTAEFHQSQDFSTTYVQPISEAEVFGKRLEASPLLALAREA